MPLYDYTCQECGNESELLINRGAEPKCPHCGSTQLNKQLSLVAAPSRDSATDIGPEPPTGPCGSACGCFPPG